MAKPRRPARRPSLPGGTEADVCIVGAGYTGLWTAYYLKRADPGLRIVVLEASFAGFGASGRNGGWVTATLPGSRARYARHPRGTAGVRELERQLPTRSTRWPGSARPKESTPAWSRAARSPSPPRRPRMPGCVSGWSKNGHGAMVPGCSVPRTGRPGRAVAGDRGGGALYWAHCARVQPADLVAGLANVVTRAGVRLHEAPR